MRHKPQGGLEQRVYSLFTPFGLLRVTRPDSQGDVLCVRVRCQDKITCLFRAEHVYDFAGGGRSDECTSERGLSRDGGLKLVFMATIGHLSPVRRELWNVSMC